MFREKLSFAPLLGSALLSGILMFIARTQSAPLWLALVLACFLTVFLFFAANLFHNDRGRYQQTPPSSATLQKITLILAALCFFITALMRLPQLIRDGMIFSLFSVVAPVLAAVACVLRLLVGEEHRRSGPFSMIPVFFLCVLLLNFYRANSYHPDTEAFGYEIIVFSLLLLGVFFTASSKYKKHPPYIQRFWALLPLSGCVMELCMLLLAPAQLYRAEDMNTATLLGMAGACALLLFPLLSPVQPVSKPEDPCPEETAETQEVNETTDPSSTEDVSPEVDA